MYSFYVQAWLVSISCLNCKNFLILPFFFFCCLRNTQYCYLKICVCLECMLWSRFLAHGHHSSLLVFCDSLLEKVCLSFQGNVFHEVKWIWNIVNLWKKGKIFNYNIHQQYNKRVLTQNFSCTALVKLQNRSQILQGSKLSHNSVNCVCKNSHKPVTATCI